MPSIDESIRKIDNVICRHLDEIENNSRGAISQDILEQLTKFVNHVMLKFYANGREIPITAENIAKATEFAQINSELYTLYKFHNYLEVMKIFQDAGFKLKELIIKQQHNCGATGYWKTNSVKYNFLLIAHEYLFVFKK